MKIGRVGKEKYIIVFKDDYPGEWPFSEKRIMVTKDQLALIVRVNHKKYNLNGVGRIYRPLEEIWLDNPKIEGTKIPIGDFIRFVEREMN